MFLISYVAHLLYLLSLCCLSFHKSWLSFGNLMKAIRVNVFDGNEMYLKMHLLLIGQTLWARHWIKCVFLWFRLILISSETNNSVSVISSNPHILLKQIIWFSFYKWEIEWQFLIIHCKSHSWLIMLKFKLKFLQLPNLWSSHNTTLQLGI